MKCKHDWVILNWLRKPHPANREWCRNCGTLKVSFYNDDYVLRYAKYYKPQRMGKK